MSDAMTSSFTNVGTNLQRNPGSPHSLYHPDGAPQAAPQSDENMTPLLPVVSLEEEPLVPNKSVAELTVRRLSREIEQAKEELQELEKTLAQELLAPSVRGWLLPLMAIGLALSLYGSFSASNSAELGATGLMLLWSLSAFWFIYTREKRLDAAKKANSAEIEIWTSRIEELQRTFEQNQRIVEAASES
jgi:hypothetical protein